MKYLLLAYGTREVETVMEPLPGVPPRILRVPVPRTCSWLERELEWAPRNFVKEYVLTGGGVDYSVYELIGGSEMGGVR